MTTEDLMRIEKIAKRFVYKEKSIMNEFMSHVNYYDNTLQATNGYMGFCYDSDNTFALITEDKRADLRKMLNMKYKVSGTIERWQLKVILESIRAIRKNVRDSWPEKWTAYRWDYLTFTHIEFCADKRCNGFSVTIKDKRYKKVFPGLDIPKPLRWINVDINKIIVVLDAVYRAGTEDKITIKSAGPKEPIQFICGKVRAIIMPCIL